MMLDKGQNRFEYHRKPRVCPVCQSKRIATILWGYPAFSEELLKALEEGRVTLGGCCISFDGPKWQCADCETVFYKINFEGDEFEHH